MATQATDNPWAILLCKWNDKLSEPFQHWYYEDLFSTPGVGFNNMVDFFRLYSHGNLDLSGSQVFGWFVLPHARSEYTGSGGSGDAGRQQLIAWAKEAATAAGVDLSKFFGVVVCMNSQTDLFGDMCSPAVVCDNLSSEPSPLGQEMLHGYCVNHARLNGSTQDYTDPFDVMSVYTNLPCIATTDPNFTQIGPGLNAAIMDSKGWLDPERVWTYSGGNSTVQLRPHHRRDLPGFLVAKVGPYYVELRVAEGFDAGISNCANGLDAVVLVHRFDPDGHSYLMPATGGALFLTDGTTFEGPIGRGPVRLVVTVTQIDRAQLIATLNVGTKGLLRLVVRPTPTPLGVPISLEIDAFDQFTGQAVTGTVSLTYGDQLDLPTHISFPTGTAQSITLDTWLEVHIDGKGHITETTEYPYGTVTASTFATAKIPFAFK